MLLYLLYSCTTTIIKLLKFQRNAARGKRVRVGVRFGRGLAQLPSLVPVGLPRGRVRAALQPDHAGDRLLRGDGLGVGQEVRDAGHGAQPGDEARRRHPPKVRAAVGEGPGRRSGRRGRRRVRRAVLAGGPAQANARGGATGLNLSATAAADAASPVNPEQLFSRPPTLSSHTLAAEFYPFRF